MEKQSEMCFADIAMGFECIRLIGEAYLILNNAAIDVLLTAQADKNNHAEYVKAKYIKNGMMPEEQTNQNVPYLCKNCDAKDCDYLNSRNDFLRCPEKIRHDEREKSKLNSGGAND
jgi:hypothetical protein